MDATTFQLGIDRLCGVMSHLIASRRIGLLAHPASTSSTGEHASLLLRIFARDSLRALFGPEHGYFGFGAAGEDLGHIQHEAWGIPIHSLYGEHRRPTQEMLDELDAVVFDLQDIGIRCYTFVSTLRYVMEACAQQGKEIIVCDRPIPQPNIVDGAAFDPRFESFVGAVDVPLVYGMTPGEAALFINKHHRIGANLTVVSMLGYRREARRDCSWGDWTSPSPGIRHWETAWYYPSTVYFEALPAIEYGRGSTEPFQVIMAPFIDAEQLAGHLNEQALPGVRFMPYWSRLPGVRMQCTDPDKFHPVTTGLHIIRSIQNLYGMESIWGQPGVRPDFFDKLAGGDATRLALQGSDADFQAFVSRRPSAEFMAARKGALLYP